MRAGNQLVLLASNRQATACCPESLLKPCVHYNTRAVMHCAVLCCVVLISAGASMQELEAVEAALGIQLPWEVRGGLCMLCVQDWSAALPSAMKALPKQVSHIHSAGSCRPQRRACAVRWAAACVAQMTGAAACSGGSSSLRGFLPGAFVCNRSCGSCTASVEGRPPGLVCALQRHAGA